MADPIRDYVDLIHEQQQTLVDQRAVFNNEIANHLLTLPGMSELFDTEESRSMLGEQIGTLVEAQARTKAAPPPAPPEPPPLEDVRLPDVNPEPE